MDPSSVFAIEFSLVGFNKIVPWLSKLSRFTRLETVVFGGTNLSRLKQMSHLTVLQNIRELDILPEQNPVTSLPFFRQYAVFTLAHLPLRKLCGKEVTRADWDEAELHFGALRLVLAQVPSITAPQIPDRTFPKRADGNGTADNEKTRFADVPNGQVSSNSASSMGMRTTGPTQQKSARFRQLAQGYTQSVISSGTLKYQKLQLFNQLWPKMIAQVCSAALAKVHNYDVAMVEAFHVAQGFERQDLDENSIT
ncbi:Leucine-rich repeat-containing protein 49 [Borealophlyctis nickersoniae]|nr:Leucine-rich repeat-containing protein 49 [Borealophlyctis nickersoniae]